MCSLFRRSLPLLISVASAALAGCSSGAGASDTSNVTEGALERSDVYTCAESEARGVGAKLTFDRDHKLKSAVLLRVPYRDFANSQTFDGSKGHKVTGANAEQEFAHVTWEVPTIHVPLEAEISYLTKEKSGDDWKSLSLDESLLGENHADNGEAYGRLRVDITIPNVDIQGDVGSTYFLFCKKP